MKKTIFVILIGFLAGCATTAIPRGPSEYLLSADRSVTDSLRDVRRTLEANRYVTDREDLEAGFLIMKSRRFTIEKGGSDLKARQIVQVRQEGGSMKIRLVYECKYEQRYTSCLQNDEDIQAKISRLELPLLEALRPILMSRTANAGESGDRGGSGRTRSKDLDIAPPLEGY